MINRTLIVHNNFDPYFFFFLKITTYKEIVILEKSDMFLNQIITHTTKVVSI